jgi:hypothetical protein
MAALRPQTAPIKAIVRVKTVIVSAPLRRKMVAGKSKRALRILAGAIEYTANEFLREAAPPGPGNGRFEAVQLLMALNRKVYSECPDVPIVAGRFRWLARLSRS